jgi:uncharacterized repeat protein (TIGR01451 family)
MWIYCNEEHFQKLHDFGSSKRMSQRFEYSAAFSSILSGEKIMQMKSKVQNSRVRPIARTWIYAPVIATSFLALAQPTYAGIDNSATASGTYGVTTVTSAPSLVSIPVVTANPSLSMTKTVLTPATIGAGNASITDAGDTITYQYVILNTGNVTISGVTPVDTGPSFGNPQTAGTGSMGAFTTVDSTTLLPGATATFTAVYTLSAVDVYRAAGITNPPDAVNNTATASGTAPDLSTVTSAGDTATTTIAPGPLLSVTKVGNLVETNGNTTDLLAEVNDVITYTYTVVNTGNVAITGVVINDTHEGSGLLQSVFTEALTAEGPLGIPASTDASGVNGSWDVIQPGATVTFTYVHTVTQAEVDGG